MPHNTTQHEHAWNVSPKQAIAIQKRLRASLRITAEPLKVNRIAGVDVGFEDGGETTRAAIVVLDAQTLGVLEQTIARLPTSMPYIPGLLSFREVPAVMLALGQLAKPPDLLMCDGHGIAHPRRMGIACHLGLLTNLPSLGVAKSRLTGSHAEVPDQRGAWTPLLQGEETLGAVLRSRVNVKPIYISAGHRINLETAIDWTLHCLTRYRLPETTRAADKLASNKNK